MQNKIANPPRRSRHFIFRQQATFRDNKVQNNQARI
jgi:hypothetical protein